MTQNTSGEEKSKEEILDQTVQSDMAVNTLYECLEAMEIYAKQETGRIFNYDAAFHVKYSQLEQENHELKAALKSQPYWPGEDEIKEGATRELVEGGWINVFSTRGEMDNFKEIFITAISWLKQRLTESQSK